MELSNAANHLQPSAIRKMFERAREFDDSVNLSLGEPGFITPDNIIRVGADYLLRGRTKYTPNAGILPLREAIAAKLQKENGIRCNPATELIVTAGATQALLLCVLTLVSPGDEVIIPDPSWPDYYGQVVMANGVPVGAKVTAENGFKTTADIIERCITDKTKLIMINSPSNPTGAMLNRAEMADIADLVRRRKLFVISDEPYEKIVYDGHEHVSLASFPGIEEYVITMNSFSKAYAMTGWRVGYACSNERVIANMVKLHENMIGSVNEAFQWAAIEALEHGDEDVEKMRQAYDRNRRLIVDGLNAINGFACPNPQGAFYIFPKVTGLGSDSTAVADMILDKTHVVTSPGIAFGPGGQGHLRMSYANDYESIQEALQRLEKAFGLK
ncbi:MAG: pyridoxal phosphate-dependent aminotransferase [Planctomycetaceae bacterium]|nr:pyridoxal phosphate-dependent aminotransferase [Planctomycetaceae bacterium]